MGPHLAVHGRGDQQRHAVGRTRQAQQAQQLVGAALHQPRDEIGAAGRQHDRVGLAAQVDVRHVVRLAGVPLRGVDGAPRERLHGDRRHELLGRLGHHDLDGGARLHEQAAQLGRFVAGDAPCESEDDVFAGEILHGTYCCSHTDKIRNRMAFGRGGTKGTPIIAISHCPDSRVRNWHDQICLRHRWCRIFPWQGNRLRLARRDPRIARPPSHPHQARSVHQRRPRHDVTVPAWRGVRHR
ncbi:hypothetical protein FQZ97_756670 [compost metagenome]